MGAIPVSGPQAPRRHFLALKGPPSTTRHSTPPSRGGWRGSRAHRATTRQTPLWDPSRATFGPRHPFTAAVRAWRHPQRTRTACCESLPRMRIVRDLPRPVRTIDHVWIPLADGTRLGARIWLPEDAESDPVPAILEYIPYRKGDGTAPRDHPRHTYFAGHGYAVLRVDLRGSGESDGLLHDEYLPQEQEDAVEVLRWIGEQPWCTGAAGMFGISWGGFNGLQVAARRPPELKAVISLCSTDDRYADDVHYRGGAVLALEMLSWGASMLSFNAIAPDPEVAGPGWREAWLERIDSVEPYEYEWLRHQRRDDYWKQGSVCEDFGAIECPVYAIGGWADGYSEAVLRLVAGLGAPSKGLIGPWSHSFPDEVEPGPAIGFLQECLRWWDQWLKGEDTGIADEPLLRVWMQEPVAARGPARGARRALGGGGGLALAEHRGATAVAGRRPARRGARHGRPPARDLHRPALRPRQRRVVRGRQRGRQRGRPAGRGRPRAQLHVGRAPGADRADGQRARGAGAGQRPPGRADRRAALRRGPRRQLAARDPRRAQPHAPGQPRAPRAARTRRPHARRGGARRHRAGRARRAPAAAGALTGLLALAVARTGAGDARHPHGAERARAPAARAAGRGLRAAPIRRARGRAAARARDARAGPTAGARSRATSRAAGPS